MIIKNKNYPHPVLAPYNDDIQQSPMSCDVDITWDKSFYYLSYELSIDNKTIADLIINKQIHFILHVECGKTFYRKAHRIDAGDFADNWAKGKITISSNQLKDKTEVSVFVCSTSTVTGYQPIRMHPDYGMNSFSLENSDFVAAWQTYKFDLYQDYDPIKKTDSIISFQRDMERDTGEITVYFRADKLTALLPKDVHQLYLDLCADKSKENIFMAMLGVPIIMEGLSYLKDKTETDEGAELSTCRQKRWFRSLEKKLSDMNIDITAEESMFETAQKIFENPCRKAGVTLTNLDEH